MISVNVAVRNLDTLRANFAKAPAISLKYLAAATKAAILEVEKQAVDRNFQFKWPRSMRTGYLALSFSYGRQFSSNGLRGSIGPTAFYAPYVYFGTRHTRSNYFMDRIAAAAQGGVNAQFNDAVEKIAIEIAAV